MRHVVGRVVRTEDRQAEREEPVAAGEASLAEALHLAARHRHFTEMLLAGLRIGLRRAVQEQRADAGIGKALHSGVAVRGRRIVVAPVDQRGRAVVDLVERAHQIGDVDVFRAEQRRKPAMHRLHVLRNRPVGGKPAQAGLPGVQMAVDQARQEQHPRAVDDLGVIGGDARRDGGDTIRLDQHIALRQIADRSVHAHNGRAFDQCPTHGFSFCCLLVVCAPQSYLDIRSGSTWPPSMSMVAPCSQRPRGDTMKATSPATSSGLPKRVMSSSLR